MSESGQFKFFGPTDQTTNWWTVWVVLWTLSSPSTLFCSNLSQFGQSWPENPPPSLFCLHQHSFIVNNRVVTVLSNLSNNQKLCKYLAVSFLWNKSSRMIGKIWVKLGQTSLFRCTYDSDKLTPIELTMFECFLTTSLTQTNLILGIIHCMHICIQTRKFPTFGERAAEKVMLGRRESMLNARREGCLRQMVGHVFRYWNTCLDEADSA